MKRINTIWSVLFLLLIVGFFLVGFVCTLFFPKEINDYENRYATKVFRPNAANVLNQSFQNNLEKALADQIPFSQQAKKLYNDATSGFLNLILDPVRQANPDSYILFRDVYFFGEDSLVYAPTVLSSAVNEIDNKIDNYNTIIANHPGLEFYVYYIERDVDIDFETGEKTGSREHILAGLNIQNQAYLEIDSFETFQKYFYKTDHHWNSVGSYLAYTQIHDLLGCTDQVIAPDGEIYLGRYSGSKASTAGAGFFSEDFYVYKFPYPNMEYRINGKMDTDFGAAEAYFNGEIPVATYAKFYGPDAGEAVFTTENMDAGNILVIGESNDNAILKLIASHFYKTYAVDLRNYKTQMGEKFSFSKYVAENEIDKVLFIGNLNFFIERAFLLEE